MVASQDQSLRDRVAALGEATGAARVCVTRGEEGAALWCRGALRGNGLRKIDAFVECSGFDASREGNADTVGAGDAFLAAASPFRALERACALGAYVASCAGALPPHAAAPPNLRRIFSPTREL